jgi:peptide/nickel transport system permease protein
MQLVCRLFFPSKLNFKNLLFLIVFVLLPPNHSASLPKFTAFILLFLVILGLTGQFMANMRPLWCKIDQKTHWPVFESLLSKQLNVQFIAFDEQNKWQSLPSSDRIMPLVPFTAALSSPHKGLAPLTPVNGVRHWLGTDERGRDVLACLITGAQTCLFTATLVLLVSLLVGGLLGGIAGYFGNDQLTLRWSKIVLGILSVLFAFFFLFLSREGQSEAGLTWFQIIEVVSILAISAYALEKIAQKFQIGIKTTAIPVDTIIMRMAETFESIPIMVLLLISASFIKDRTLTKVIILIGVFIWTGTARFLRSELLKVRKMDYIIAAQRLGIPAWRVLLKHAMPNAIRPVLLMLTLSASSAILIESSLSFLNLGSNDITIITWGKMLQTARNNIELWWVWLPPGVLIALVSYGLFVWNDKSKFA